MNDWISKGKEILKILINNGFEAYFIGKVVRDTIMEKDITSVDIVTSASLNVVKSIFKGNEIDDVEERVVELTYNDYKYFVQTFYINIEGKDTTPLNKHYSKSLLGDLANRDFTINAIAMSHSGKLTDAYSGYEDILKKKISIVGSAKQRVAKDPTLMIKSISLVSELKFDIALSTRKTILKKRKLLLNTKLSSLIDEFQKIFSGKYAKKALDMIFKLNLDRSFPKFRKALCILQNRYRQVDFEEVLLMSSVLNKKIDDEYLENVDNPSVFNSIFTLASTSPKAQYDSMTLFASGLEICLEANRINYLVHKSRNKSKKIKKLYEALPIKRVCDLEYKGQDIMKIISKNDYDKIPELLDEVILKIINNEISNDKDEIETFVVRRLQELKIGFDLNRASMPLEELKEEIAPTMNFSKEEVVSQKSEIVEEEPYVNMPPVSSLEEDTYTSHRLTMIEQKLEEQARQLQEKELKLQKMQEVRTQNDIKSIVSNVENYIQKNETIQYLVNDKERFSSELFEFIYNFVKEEEN